MREIMPYIWIGIIISATVVELNFFSRVAVWFIPAGLTAFIFSLLGLDVWMQVLLFFMLTPVLLILSRTFFKKNKKLKNIPSLAGQTAIVTKEINNHKNTGEVRIKGLAWPARAEEEYVIYESALIVTVIDFDGKKAICSR
jgi:membrane protein implicated in regulation of membrane protease activity